jgi:hypothetical protein
MNDKPTNSNDAQTSGWSMESVGKGLTNFGSSLVDNIGKATGLGPSAKRLAGVLGFGGTDPTQDQAPVTAYQFRGKTFFKDSDRRVKIRIPSNYLQGPAKHLADVGDNAVVFPYTPQIVVQTRANYNGLNPTHSNYTFYSYQNSMLDTISIVGTFSAQNEQEARYVLGAIHALRSVTKMNFGTGNNIGAPPPVCKLYGYGTYQFNDMPVVISSFFYTLNEDVDYINVIDENEEGTAVPTRAEFTIECLPAFSRKDQALYSVDKFVKGTLTQDKGMI